jgi:pimeloyl-ACP methyl ester carboxylesterase
MKEEQMTGNYWKLISSQPVEGTNLIETVWHTHRPPEGEYDTVGLRRLIADNNLDPAGVIVYLPPSATSARLYTNSQDYDFRIYLANRGYDVFSVDYRASFVPSDETDISCMAKWTTRVHLDDIQEAVKFVKEMTGAEKVYLAGHSTGARYVYLYAAERWEEDVAGMIVLDGAPWESYGPEELYAMDIDKCYAALSEGDTPENRNLFKSYGLAPGDHYYEATVAEFDSEFYEAIGAYLQDLGARSPVPDFDTAKDYIASQFHHVWGAKQFANVLEGYASVGMLVAFVVRAAVPYWPLVDYAEEAYIGNWNGKPPKPELQFHDGICEIDVPLIVFASEEWTTALGMQFWYKQLGPVMVKSADTEFHLLENFGHIDVLLGEYAKQQVFEPLYGWLLKHHE